MIQNDIKFNLIVLIKKRLLLLLFLFISSCSIEGMSVSGHIYNSNGEPIKDAEVILHWGDGHKDSDFSKEDGFFYVELVFEAILLVPGSPNLDVVKDGYMTFQGGSDISLQDTVMDIFLNEED